MTAHKGIFSEKTNVRRLFDGDTNVVSRGGAPDAGVSRIPSHQQPPKSSDSSSFQSPKVPRKSS
jgi:hypothetical protein